ncbi:MAG: hypothetical protein V2A73_03505 [Pseudomonadota bacterium]
METSELKAKAIPVNNLPPGAEKDDLWGWGNSNSAEFYKIGVENDAFRNDVSGSIFRHEPSSSVSFEEARSALNQVRVLAEREPQTWVHRAANSIGTLDGKISKPIGIGSPDGIVGGKCEQNCDKPSELAKTAMAAEGLSSLASKLGAIWSAVKLGVSIGLMAIVSAGGKRTATGVVKPSVANAKLGNLVDDLYKGARTQNPIGTGSTADAIRHEMATGQAVGGKFHTQKGQEYARALEKWLKKNQGTSSAEDRTAAQSILEDLRNALSGK